MRDILTLFLHSMVTIIRLARPGGLRAVVAEAVLMRHQLLILNRGRKRRQRVHSGLGGRLPDPEEATTPLKLDSYRWQQHCRGLYQTPSAA